MEEEEAKVKVELSYEASEGFFVLEIIQEDKSTVFLHLNWKALADLSKMMGEIGRQASEIEVAVTRLMQQGATRAEAIETLTTGKDRLWPGQIIWSATEEQ